MGISGLVVVVAQCARRNHGESGIFVECPASGEELGRCESRLPGVLAEVLDRCGLELRRQGRGAADGRTHAPNVASVHGADSPCHGLATQRQKEDAAACG